MIGLLDLNTYSEALFLCGSNGSDIRMGSSRILSKSYLFIIHATRQIREEV